MIRIPCFQSCMTFRIFFATALMAVFFVGQVGAQTAAYVDSIGPGIAGQIHALAYDPDDANTVIVGSDVGGVFRSDDHGLSWYSWSEGLQNTNLTLSMYVDDLYVLNDSTVAASYHGVWAATHGGIYYRPLDGGSWTLKSTSGGSPLSFSGMWEATDSGDKRTDQPFPDLSRPIPFSSLAYDPVDRVLYAGAGHGRWVDKNHPWAFYYPENFDETGTTKAGQYSLWRCDLAGSGTWEYVQDAGNRGIVRQLSVSSDLNDQRIVVFATRSGIWAYETVSGLMTNIWGETPNKDINWGGTAWGIATGADKNLYCLRAAVWTNPTDSVPAEAPGVYACNTGTAPLDFVTWAQLDSLHHYIEPYTVAPDTTSLGRLFATEIDLIALTVVPGETGAEDEIYVGHRDLPNRAGFLRYGKYWADTDPPEEKTGWMFAVFSGDADYDVGTRYNEIVYSSLDWTTVPYTKDFGSLGRVGNYDAAGWCSNKSLAITAPLIVHPSDRTRIFASAFHTPIASETSGSIEWSQRYCQGGGQGSAGAWNSRGINLGAARSLAFDSSGRVYLGTHDFGVLQSDLSKSSYSWLDWYQDASDVAEDLAIYKGKIAAVMLPPSYGRNGDALANRFGFAEAADASGTQQKHVIGVSEVTLDHFEPSPSFDGYGWRYISRGLDGILAGLQFDIADIETVGDDTIFAACVKGGVSTIFRGTGAPTSMSWDYVKRMPADCEIVEMRNLPGTSRLVVAAKGSGGGVFCFDTADTTAFQTWLLHSQLSAYGQRAFTNVSTVACDVNGTVVYVGTEGGRELATGNESIGAVFRLDIPPYLNATTSDWAIIANDEGANSFGFVEPVEPSYWPDDWTGGDAEAGRRLTQIKDIAVDPGNPHRIYVGMYCEGPQGTKCLHPNAGVWQFDPLGAVPAWSQLIGGEYGERPTRGVAALEIDPFDPSSLYFGTYGRGFFRADIDTATNVPVIADRAEYAIVDYQDPFTWTTLAVRVQSTSGSPIDTVFADLRSLNPALQRLQPLNDSGDWGADDFADDGVWSVSFPVNSPEPLGDEVSIRVVARDTLWNCTAADVVVDVIAPIGELTDRSSVTVALKSPYGAGETPAPALPIISVPLDWGYDRLSSESAAVDVVAILEDEPAQIFTVTGFTMAGDPEFGTAQSRTTNFDVLPPDSTISATVVDYNNDGYEDLLLCVGPYGPVKLYRYNPASSSYKFQDITNTAFPNGVPNAQAAAWGDYDQDGWVDLLIVSHATPWQPMPKNGPSGIPGQSGPGAVAPAIFKNQRGKFVHAKTGFGAGATSLFAATSYSAMWCDVNGDGRLDAVVADYYGEDSGFGSSTRVVENTGWNAATGDYEFAEVTANWIGSAPDGVVASEFADFDGDGDADLILVGVESGDNLRIFLNEPGGGTSGITIPSVEFGMSDAVVVDLDRNGWLDLVTLPYVDGNIASVALNGLQSSSAAEFTLVDAYDATELGAIPTGFAHDWTDDGRGELYLARDPDVGPSDSAMEHFFYRNQLQNLSGGGENSFLNVRLVGGGRCDVAALGARVDVYSDPGYTNRVAPAYWVSGGNGRGRQNSRVLSIGLKQQISSVYIRVTWPDGGTTEFDEVPANQSTEVILEDPRQVTLVESSMEESKTLEFGGALTWCFEWVATRPLSGVFVELELDPLGTNPVECMCDYSEPTIVWYDHTSSEATLEVERVSISQYRHSFTVDSWCCAQSCDYRYRVGGRFAGQTFLSAWKTPAKIKSCLKDLPPPPPGP